MLLLMYVHAIKMKIPSNVPKKTVVKHLLIRFVIHFLYIGNRLITLVPCIPAVTLLNRDSTKLQNWEKDGSAFVHS